ncbi:MAG: zinc protease [Verrucomicrobiales bacterium]
MPNSEPPDRVSIRLYVDAGSIHEDDDQRGLAHFLEHMAFNGTKNFPAGEMVEYFQRLGMGFGSHTNAHTWWKETVYKLELPQAEPEMLDDGFKLLRDYADGILFGAEEIEKERGVILSEKRTRDDPGYRAYQDWIKFATPETIFPDRITIGTEEVISNAPRQRFLDFYNKWYTADRMSVLVVGDIKADEIEGLIKQYFENLPAAAERVPDPDYGKIPQRGVVAHHYHDDEASDTNVSIETLRLSTLGPDTQARRERELKIRIANTIIGRRFEILAKAENATIIRGFTGYRELNGLPWAEYTSIDATCKPESWEAALATIDQELRRAIQYGFTESEMAEAKANLANALENQANSAATRKSRSIADQIVELIRSNRVFTHPSEDLKRVGPLLESITAESCADALRDIWGDRSQVAIYANGKVVVKGGDAEVLAAYKKSLETAVEAPAQAETGEFAYAAEMKPGKIASRGLVEDLAVTQIKFGNNVRANFKVTDYEADTIRVGLRVGSGTLTEPKDKPGLGLLLGSTFGGGGLEAHSTDELQRVLAGKSVGAGFGVGDDAFTLGGGTTPADLLLQLQLMRAYVTNPGFREEAERVFKAEIDQLYQILDHSPQGIQAGKVDTFLHSGDTRFGYPEREQLLMRTTAEAKSWVMPELKNGYLEISVVGDFDLEAAVAAVARTFGTLPERAESKPAYEAERKVAFPTDAGEQKVFTFESEIPKSSSLLYWPTVDRPSDVGRARRLSLLSSVFSDRIRIKIREELGDAYSPRAHNIPSDAFTGYGYLFAMAEGAPPQAQKLADVMKELGADLAEGGVSADEVERAKAPLLTMIEEMIRTNPYWLDRVIGSSQEHPYRLDWARTFLSDYRAVTKEELSALAKEFLGADDALKVLVTPVDPEK